MAPTVERATHARGVAAALMAALLFGVSAPLAKLLLADTPPLLLSGLLYLGAGAGLTMFAAGARWLRAWRAVPPPGDLATVGEARLRGGDALPLAGVILFGGVLGPLLLLLGLARLSGLAAALLLNLEAPLTMLLALALFREHLGRREAGGVALILLGGVALAVAPGELRAAPLGVVAVALACLAWAVDNNLTTRLALRDPVTVSRWKTLGAGSASLALALATGARLPAARVLVPALLVGTVCYGASIVLAMYAMRSLGAARQAGYFATAPFAGALLAIPLLGERATLLDGVAAALMVAGVVLLALARHGHRHTHEPLVHDHLHVHDAHHQHPHDTADAAEPHAHPHQHQPLTHDHAHLSDAHHRHRHRH